jgi:acyl-CoA dehydrogenase
MKTLDIGRASLGAATLGGAQAAMESSIKWAKTREQFGVPIATKQSVHFMIADMAVDIEALRSLIYRVAWMIDSGQPHIMEAAICKLFGSEVSHRCIDRAMQIHGALGYSRDHSIELGWRDQRITEIYEGTNEIQKLVIAASIFRPEGLRIPT